MATPTTFGADGQSLTVFGGKVAANTAVTFWTAATGGTQITGLTLVSTGGIVSSITTGADGSMPLFTDPASHITIWADAGGNERLKIYADPTTYQSITAGGTINVVDNGDGKTFTLTGTAVSDNGDGLTFTVTS